MIIRREDYERLKAAQASLEESFYRMQRVAKEWEAMYRAERARNQADRARNQADQ